MRSRRRAAGRPERDLSPSAVRGAPASKGSSGGPALRVPRTSYVGGDTHAEGGLTQDGSRSTPQRGGPARRACAAVGGRTGWLSGRAPLCATAGEEADASPDLKVRAIRVGTAADERAARLAVQEAVGVLRGAPDAAGLARCAAFARGATSGREAA